MSSFEEKVELFKKGGRENLQIITDFDATLTRARNDNGGAGTNSINVLRINGYISDEYSNEAKKLKDHYMPLEHDPHISEDEKAELMIEWWSKHFDILAKYGMTYQMLQEVVDQDSLHLKKNFVEFFDIARENEIPTLIFSAGVGEVIRLYLDKYELKNDLVHVISNILEFDNEGKFLGIEGEIIHSENKNMVAVSHFPYFDQVRDRKNIILMGDSYGDLKMSEGFGYENIIRIGFFNKKEADNDYEAARKRYYDAFDLVYENDEGLDEVIKLIKSIV